ncbi:MAG TPA: dockerin type I repeat-containing protein, partial [Ignavibacteriaceae bacterium]|nr:dockerin type I repeat-containing protein [Ignavibacteriaceae bacterium]
MKYRVADLPALQDSIKSSIRIINAEASTFEGFPIDITPSRDELTVIARNRVGFYGDVNGDGCLDILDIIKVVDHIVGRDSLDEDEFQRADIAPWIRGNENPDPDGVVNVQDLSLLQNIILTGFYPNGVEINACSYVILSKQNDITTSKITFYVNREGITVYSDAEFDICAAQLEFDNFNNNPEGLYINTDLGEGYYQKVNNSLRVLLYDRSGKKIVQSGKHLMADIPINISNPELIT